MSALVIPCCDGAEVFESIDPALDHVAALVGLGIEGGGTPALGAPCKAMLLGIFALGANTLDAAALDLVPWLSCAVSAIDTQTRGTLLWTARTNPRNGNGVEHGFKLADVGTLACRHHQG